MTKCSLGLNLSLSFIFFSAIVPAAKGTDHGAMARIDIAFNRVPILTTAIEFQNAPAAGSAPAQSSDVSERDKANQRFAEIKAHFKAGLDDLDTLKSLKSSTEKLSKGVQEDSQVFIKQSVSLTVTEFRTALDLTAENDPNRSMILGKLGETYQVASDWQQSADYYKAAVALKPQPGYYNNLGTVLAKLKQLDAALGAFQSAINLDPAHAGMYWLNYGIVLVNADHFKEALVPLQEATAADPNKANAWYVLGLAWDGLAAGPPASSSSRLQAMQAYQKAIALDPSGPSGQSATQKLDALRSKGSAVNRTPK